MKETKQQNKPMQHEEDLHELTNRVMGDMKSLFKFSGVAAIVLTMLKIWLG